MNISLEGISKTGKQRVREYGAAWRVLDKRDAVLFSSQRGPWLLVVPSNRDEHDAASRWVHAISDHNFKVMPFAG